MQTHFTGLDWLVLCVYFAITLSLGFVFWRRSHSSSDQFVAGGRSLPGWLCGLSIFATFLSSISYLALPGKAFAGNWNAFVFGIGLLLAAVVAARYFVPLYRESGEVSGYAWLEKRFGLWARLYASVFFLVLQIARAGFVMYLMALPLSVIFGWDIRMLLLVTGIVVTGYSLMGGIVAVIWADALQAVVLMFGALMVLVMIWVSLPNGLGQVFESAQAAEKFSWGSWRVDTWFESTFWVVLVYGLFENLRNLGIDQCYIQRYVAARDERQALRGLWLSAGLYVPVSGLLFLIGTSLFVFYNANPQAKNEVRQLVAHQKLMQSGQQADWIVDESGQSRWSDAYQTLVNVRADELDDVQIADRVLPHFIAAHLPSGLTGLLVAAIFAAGMSTVSTSLNSSATLIMSDFYQRLRCGDANEKRLLTVLTLATIVWGLLGTGTAFLLVPLTETILDVWWKVASILGSGILGLFLLGVICPTVSSRSAMIAVIAGLIVVIWMVVSQSPLWPPVLDNLRSPLHSSMAIVIGSLTTVAVGSLQIVAAKYFTQQ